MLREAAHTSGLLLTAVYRNHALWRNRARRLFEAVGLIGFGRRKAVRRRASNAFPSGQREGVRFHRNGLSVIKSVRLYARDMAWHAVGL